MISLRVGLRNLVIRPFVATCRPYSDLPDEIPKLSAEEVWKRRRQFAEPGMQRFEKPVPKIFYAPEWDLVQKQTMDEKYDPKKHCWTTPEKWEYHNKIVWPVGHIVPETGLPKPREVFHCEQAFHYHPRKFWYSCRFAWRMKVDDALLQLRYRNNKGCQIIAHALERAKERASNEFHIDDPSKMFIAEIFGIQYKILKSARRHAREMWHKRRHRYIHVFIRLEEGEPPNYQGRKPLKDGWEHMDDYYQYLRSREIKFLT